MSYTITVTENVPNPDYGRFSKLNNGRPEYLKRIVISAQVEQNPVLAIAKIIDGDKKESK